MPKSETVSISDQLQAVVGKLAANLACTWEYPGYIQIEKDEHTLCFTDNEALITYENTDPWGVEHDGANTLQLPATTEEISEWIFQQVGLVTDPNGFEVLTEEALQAIQSALRECADAAERHAIDSEVELRDMATSVWLMTQESWDESEQDAFEPCGTFGELLAFLKIEHEETGGGCTAFSRSWITSQLLITDGEATTPNGWRDAVLYLMTADGEAIHSVALSPETEADTQ